MKHLVSLCVFCALTAAWGNAHILRLAVSAESVGDVSIDCFAADVEDVRTVRVEILLNMQVVAKTEVEARFRPTTWRLDTVHQQLDFALKSPQTWTAETPNLYSARVTLLDAQGKPVETSSTKIGFRSVDMRDGLFVNGKRVHLRGIICRPTVFPCSRDHVYAIKALGANAVRFADGAPDPAFLDACDELGLYVIDELPPNPASNQDEVMSIRIVRDVNHPSVIFWAHPRSRTTLHCDDAFSAWDVQHRPVLHPGCNDGNIDCSENLSWQALKGALGRSTPVLPTSLLPASGSGGLAAGFADYWQLIRISPMAIGCFIGELTDYISATSPKLPPFDAVREIWTPVSCSYAEGRLTYQNNFDFVNLGTCICTWSALTWASGEERRISAARELCPPCPAGGTTRTLMPRLPSGTEALEISVADQRGIEVSRTRFRLGRSPLAPSGRDAAPPPWLAPPRFVTLNVSNAVAVVSNVTCYTSVYCGDPSLQRSFTCRWYKLDADTYRLDYTCKFTGPVAAAAVIFDIAETCVTSCSWFGKGPHCVWANRMTGNLFGLWTSNERGFLDGVEWVEFKTTAGTVRFTILDGPSIFGVYPASDKSGYAIYEFQPFLGLGVWTRIPPLGTGECDVQTLGPASRFPSVWSDVGGSLLIHYIPPSN